MVAYATVQGTVRNFEGAHETAKTVLSLIDTIEGMDVMAHSTILGVANLLTPWFPNTFLEDIHPEFLHRYIKSMAHGDIRYATPSLTFHLCCSLIRGNPLAGIQRRF